MKPKHIHLSGICGTAMASLAGLLQQMGYRITGSDAAAYPPMSDQLRRMNIPVAEPYAESNLSPAPDLAVVGNALSRGNPEVERLLDHRASPRIPFTSMAALLHDVFLAPGYGVSPNPDMDPDNHTGAGNHSGREALVVAGTHGKTTTTSMLAWIYQTASLTQPELEPSFLIGGIAENFGSSYQLRPTRPFILEGDEYDTAFFDKSPKFMHYFPTALILTSVEFDHADIYPDLAAVKTAFRRLVNLVPRGGAILAWDGSAHVSDCLAQAFCPVERYGFTADAHWRIQDLHYADGQMRWQVHHDGALWANLEMRLAGEHNALNATAAAALAATLGVPVEAIRSALASFLSVKRRLELVATVNDVAIIDDFAHHPTAIRETLRALRRQYPARRLWAVLEPRSNTLRRNVFERELVDALALADAAVLCAVYQPTRIAEPERLHPESIVEQLCARGIPAELAPSAQAIVQFLVPRLAPGDVVAILSNGGFDGIYAKLPAALQSMSQALNQAVGGASSPEILA